MKLVVLDGYCLNPGDLSWDALRALVDVEVHDRTPVSDVLARMENAGMAMTNKTRIVTLAVAGAIVLAGVAGATG